jgi:hypothetical protein
VNARCVTCVIDIASLTKADCIMQSFLCAVEKHSKHEDAEEAHHLELWRGNVTEMLKEKARRKQLTDRLVSFAPMASQRWVLCFHSCVYMFFFYF